MKWNKLFFIAILMLPILLIGTTLTSFHTPPGSPFTDLAISHYPNTYFLQQTLLVDHTIPLWNPNILGGYPFDADPLSGLWYPPGWISLLLPLPFGLNLVILLHILAGGYGFFRYLKEVGYLEHISLLGMLCFVLMPKIYAHFGAGHVTLMYAFCLTPWLLWSEYLNGKKQVVVQSIIIAGVILADIRWLPYALLGWIANKIWNWQYFRRKREAILELFLVVLISLGLSAVFWIPFAQFTFHSTRGALTSSDNLLFSLPFGQVINLFLAVSGGTPEWVIYLGGCILLFGLIGIINGTQKWIMIWSPVVFICLMWAFGSEIPGMEYIARLPILHSLRVPPRGMFLGDFAIILLALEGMKVITSKDKPIKWRSTKLTIFGFLIFIGSISIYFVFITGEGSGVLLTGLCCVIILYGVLLFEQKRLSNSRGLILIFGLLIALDLFIADLRQFSSADILEMTQLKSTIEQTIRNNLNNGLIYSPSYSISQNIAVTHGWRLANGIHPMQYKKYVERLEKASGVPNTGYSVVQPPLINGNPYEDNRFASPESDELAKINVSIVAASYPIFSSSLKLIYQDQSIWLYKNPDYLQLPRMEQETESSTTINQVTSNPNNLKYHIVTSGGTLMTDQINYPGWLILDNGEKVEPKDNNSLYLSLDLSPGEHEVHLSYRPYLMYLGLSITFMTIIALFLFSRYSRWPRQIN